MSLETTQKHGKFYRDIINTYKKQELLTLPEHLGSSPIIGGARVAHLFSFLCCLVFYFFLLIVFVLCFVYPILPKSLNCLSMIVFQAINLTIYHHYILAQMVSEFSSLKRNLLNCFNKDSV